MPTTDGNGSGDLEREYQAIIAYVVYSRVLKGAGDMATTGDADERSADEPTHPLIISRQLDYLGGYPPVAAPAGIDARGA